MHVCEGNLTIAFPGLGQERSSWTRLMGKDVEITPRVAYWTMGCSLMGVAGAQMLVLLGNNLAGPSITGADAESALLGCLIVWRICLLMAVRSNSPVGIR